MSKSVSKAVIPAAGKGTRLFPLTKAVPKELVPLGAKPVLEHILDETIECGIMDILLIITEEKNAIKKHFGSNYCGANIEYAYQEVQLGLADAVRYSKDFVGDDNFLLLLGDSLIYSDHFSMPTKRLIETFTNTNADCVILVQDTPFEEIHKYGMVKPISELTQESFEICALVEKPKPEEFPSKYSIAGRYIFTPFIFDMINITPKGAGGEYQITDSISLLIENKKHVWCSALRDDETRRDIGTFDIYFEAFEIEAKKYFLQK
ncbi:MAG: sugar phosphate nucleotidyltransferase [Armatimonadota bacterium]